MIRRYWCSEISRRVSNPRGLGHQKHCLELNFKEWFWLFLGFVHLNAVADRDNFNHCPQNYNSKCAESFPTNQFVYFNIVSALRHTCHLIVKTHKKKKPHTCTHPHTHTLRSLIQGAAINLNKSFVCLTSSKSLWMKKNIYLIRCPLCLILIVR